MILYFYVRNDVSSFILYLIWNLKIIIVINSHSFWFVCVYWILNMNLIIMAVINIYLLWFYF